MAEVVQSLFGVTPQSYQRAQQQQIDAQALRYAQLDPFQQATYGITRGANMLGGAVAGAFGVQDPELQRITRAQQIASQIDFTDPASIQQGMAALGDDVQSKQQLAQIFRQQQESGALTAQRNRESRPAVPADIQVAREIAGLQENISRLQDTPASPERDQALRLASGQLAGLERLTAKPGEKAPAPNVKEVGVAKGTEAPVFLDVNNDQQFTYGLGPDGKQVRVPFTGAVDRTTAKTTSTVNLPPGESEFVKALGKADAGLVTEAIAARNNAIATNNSLNQLASLSDTALISGSFAEGRVGATNLLATLGLASPTDVAKLSTSQQYSKVANDVTLQTLGGKLGAGFSNEDRKFISSLVPQLETSPAARRQLIEFMQKKNQLVIDESVRLENYAREKKGLSGFKPKIPIVTPPTANRPYSGLSDAELAKKIEDARRAANR